MADGDTLVIGATNNSDLPTGLDRSGTTPWTALLVTNANGSAVKAEAAGGGTGVAGTSGAGNGVSGTSSRGFGLIASSTTGVAAGFLGSVVVVGSFTAIGGVKSAAVPHPDGSHRLTYALESPESWFEDFGRARLGPAGRVRLDPDFAALVRTDDFHVFLTAEGESPGLYVAERSEIGFEVRERRGGEGDISFSYRVVARRRDIDARRLATFDVPEAPPEPEALVPPELPEITAPAPPERPELPWETQTES